jgi:hypothetical protein
MSMKNSNDTIWNRIKDILICTQYLNHCATAVLKFIVGIFRIITEKQFSGSILLDIGGKKAENYGSTNGKSG